MIDITTKEGREELRKNTGTARYMSSVQWLFDMCIDQIPPLLDYIDELELENSLLDNELRHEQRIL